jgi:hypothetical protein
MEWFIIEAKIIFKSGGSFLKWEASKVENIRTP